MSLIKGLQSPFEAYKQIEQITKPQGPAQAEKVGGKGFGEMLTNAISEVDNLQKSADKQVENLVLGTGNTTPHEAMIALEKADVAFQLMNTVRSKIIRAYEEVMRAQV